MTREAPASLELVQTLFVVDDDAALVESLIDVLSDEGYRVEGFTAPGEALDRLRGGARPAALLLDFLMPDMTGEQFLAELAAARVDVPALVLSGLTGAIRRGPGVLAVLTKPIDLDRLLVEIDRIARPRASGRPAR
ncbi:MAG: response regulator [Polyangiaceae bacterium]|nr:response regulator [Polyangiaceae bacterium]